MKQILKVFSRYMALLFCLLPLTLFSSHGLGQELRGAWVSSVFNLDYPSKQGLSQSQLMSEADAIIAKAKESGLNTLFLQVRPCSDSIFPSEIYPWSQYVSGTQGVPPENSFDSLKYFIEQGQKSGIDIHAWLNPYRLTKGKFSDKESALASLSVDHPALKFPQSIVFHSDGNLYLDPGTFDTKALVISGISEILEKYKVAGIHLDDYFYPSKDFNDQETYNANKKSGESLDDFRRRSVTEMVYSINDLIEKKSPNLQFGISPFGVWANETDHPEGSKTKSSQSYFDHYADTKKWVKAGKIDYIMPQIYWHNGNEQADFLTLLNWWEGVTYGTGVDLYVGLAAYRIPDAKEGEPWFGTGEIQKQLAQLSASPVATGYCVFRMGTIFSIDGLSSTLSQASPQNNDSSLAITIPNQDIKTELSRFFFCGRGKDGLTVNSNPVTVNADGYFAISLPLYYGQNTFVFSDGTTSITRKIYRKFQFAEKNPILIPYENQYGSGEIPLYSTVKNGFLRLRFAFEQIKIHSFFTPTTGKVNIDYANAYSSPSTDSGAVTTLTRDSRYAVLALSGGFAHLERVGWVKLENLTIIREEIVPKGEITSIYSLEDEEKITVDFEYTGELFPAPLKTDIGYGIYVSSAADTVLPESDILDSFGAEFTKHGIFFTFSKPLPAEICGYYIEKYSTYFRLVIRKKPLATDNLTGVSILIDPGHGENSGTLTCQPGLTEKDLNLSYSIVLGEKLKNLGATVSFTRENDVNVELSQRFLLANEEKPTFFISMHSNSVNYDKNPNLFSGISLYTNNAHSEIAADFMLETIKNSGLNGEKHVKNSNLYMVKPYFSYSILIENHYATNPSDLSLLKSEEYKAKFTDTISESILQFLAQKR